MRYFIHVIADGDRFPDTSGKEFENFTVARSEAIASARELLAMRLRDDQAIAPTWAMDICDAKNQLIERLSLEKIVLGTTLTNRHRRTYETVFHPYLLLAPDFSILEANPAYLKATMTQQEQISYRALFDVFPDNPGDPEATGVCNLKSSLEIVLDRKQPNFMADQRYDIRRRDGSWEERHWRPANLPVLDDNGAIEFIVHHVTDVTDEVRRRVPA